VLSAVTKHLRETSRLVLQSAEGFNRNVYQVHKEAEFAVPLDEAVAVLEQGRELIRQKPPNAYYLLGLRISRCNERTLIGPGAGTSRESVAWIAPHLDGNMIDAAADAEWGALCRRHKGRPHYGKNMLGMDTAYLEQTHGQSWHEYLGLVNQHDPGRKFANRLIPRAVREELAMPRLDPMLFDETAPELMLESTLAARASLHDLSLTKEQP